MALGWVQVYQGRFEESRSLIREILATYQDLDYMDVSAAWLHVDACFPEQYLGAYEAARNQAQHAIDLHNDVKNLMVTNGIAAAGEILGRIALARGSYAEAQKWFLECIPVYQGPGSRNPLVQALAARDMQREV